MSAGTAYDKVLDALRDTGATVKDNGRQATGNCPAPAHPDEHPSFGVTRIEGSVLLSCRSQNCHIDDILTGLGLTRRDLYDEPSGARYDYTDATGSTVLRTVHRTPDKRFRQTVVDKVAVPLYRLPQVVAAVAAGTTVYVVEGEKDVHALESLGAVATTSPMGAANWRKVDPSPLAGAHVVVVADRDETGKTYATAVVASLRPLAASVEVRLAKVGKDAADHVAAGYGLDDLVQVEAPTEPEPLIRTVQLTPASAIKVRPVHWLWADRIALGTLALLGGREGIGKSTIGYTIAADVTNGRLPGRHASQPKAVIVAATEDSWSHTIVPRLLAAGADLDRVYRVDVMSYAGVETGLSLPRDLAQLEDSVRTVDAALILLDPLMSRLDAKLDTHKDAEVRLALEPLVRLAEVTGAAILGLIHVNKMHSTDPLTTLMASRAFAAVSRGVLFVMLDPDDETTRLLGQPKNNLGRTDLPTLTFRIGSAHVADTDEGPVWTGRVQWTGERDQSIRDALEAAGETADARSATSEAAGWLLDYLSERGGVDDSASIKNAGRKAGHSKDALLRGLKRLKGTTESSGFPRRTYWSLPDATATQSTQPSGESTPTAMTASTATTDSPVGAVGAVSAVVVALPEPCADCGWPIDSIGHADCQTEVAS